jgi:uncharacterized protein (TIGR02145 family)
MKKSLFCLVFCCLAAAFHAQPPQLIPYQAIARDNSGNPVLNQNIGLRFSIHDQTISGTVVWQESQTVVSNNLGIIVTALGGTVQLTSVDWGSGAKFLQVEMDITGGSSYIDMGTQQMMSVPYALYAETAGTVNTSGSSNFDVGSTSLLGDTLYTQSNGFIIIPGLSAANNGGLDATCGAENILNHNLSYGSLTDIDGNLYKTIQIGSQEWMAENLKVSHYNNGNLIPFVPNAPNSDWANLNSGAYTWYNNDSASYNCPYGKFYNGLVTTNSSNVCPVAWHVPTASDWQILLDFAGGFQIAGPRLKSAGYEYWNLYGGNGPTYYLTVEQPSNCFGFSALPYGLLENGVNYNLGDVTFFLSSTAGTYLNEISVLGIGGSSTSADLHPGMNIRAGYPIRCVKDN